MYVGTSVHSPRQTVEVAILVNDREQPLYRRPWDGKIFVAGQPGQAYRLQVRNLTARRIEVINTIDGRNSLRDEPGDAQLNTGLVFGATHTGCITGWRLNNSETAEFVFGTPGRSLAAQATGSPSNVGVIGFAIYREMDLSAYLSPFATRGVPKDFSTMGPTRGGSLGTGIGATQQDRVSTTTFTRSGAPDILVIGYDVEEVLHQQGVFDLDPAEPNPFPGFETGYRRYQARD